MKLTRRQASKVLVASAGYGLVGPRAFGDDAARRPTKEDLNPQTWSDMHALIRPHAHEWRHLKVHWLTDVVAARKKAAAEDKPLVICYTGGAGYNEPLGVC